MEPEIKRAALKASAKLGIGLLLLASMIGLRIVTATSSGVESGIEELERLEAQMSAEAAGSKSDSSKAQVEVEADVEPGEEDSFGSRMTAKLRDHLPGSNSEPDEGERLVSCNWNGRVHFMRSDDCASRGARSTDFSDDR